MTPKTLYYCKICGRVELIPEDQEKPEYCMTCYNKYKTKHHKHKLYKVNQ